jgi:hypothetical protein
VRRGETRLGRKVGAGGAPRHLASRLAPTIVIDAASSAGMAREVAALARPPGSRDPGGNCVFRL